MEVTSLISRPRYEVKQASTSCIAHANLCWAFVAFCKHTCHSVPFVLPPINFDRTSETPSHDNSTLLPNSKALSQHAAVRIVVWERELHLLLHQNLKNERLHPAAFLWQPHTEHFTLTNHISIIFYCHKSVYRYWSDRSISVRNSTALFIYAFYMVN